MKRILSIDGGGIRGVFALQILARIEELLRVERGNPKLVLRDEFDMFAGTSTGAILATALAWGMPVADVNALYTERMTQIFAARPWHRRWQSKYDHEVIARLFREVFTEDDAARTPALLGTRKLWNGEIPKYLLVVMRNASTGSPWPVSNNPLAMYNNPELPDNNLQIPIWQLLRASTAAPTFFPPEQIQMGTQSHLFVDGGITPYNNPAVIAMLTATLPAYRINWPASPEELLLVSVGTGLVRTRLPEKEASRIHVVDQAAMVAPSLLSAVAVEQDMLCRILGACRFGEVIDSEIGDLSDEGLLPTSERKFSYVRYNRVFSDAELGDLLRDSGQRFSLDNLNLIPFLMDHGQRFADQSVRTEHLLPRQN